jgi:hypothetical protein
MISNTRITSKRQRLRRVLSVAGVVLGAATLSLATGLPAQASTTVLTVFPAGIPADAPPPISGGDVLAAVKGTLGVPTVIQLEHGVEALATTAPGAPVKTVQLQADASNSAQRWYFQYAASADDDNTKLYPGNIPVSVGPLRFYRIINYTTSIASGAAPAGGASTGTGISAGTSTGTSTSATPPIITCLTQPANDPVLSTTCDPQNMGQYWTPVTASDGGRYLLNLQNIPSSHAQPDGSGAVLTAGQRLSGYDSILVPLPAPHLGNALWSLAAVTPPVPTPPTAPPNPSCSGYGCLTGLS